MTQRTRIYPVHARISFLVYGLMLSIGVFFFASFIAYAARFILVPQEYPLPSLPRILWFSTGLLFLGSHFLWRAYAQIRREHQSRFKAYLTASLILGGAFCILQSLGMWSLFWQHHREAVHKSGVIAAVLLMIFMHVGHFLAGYIALGYVTFQAFRGRYDHEYHNGVRLAAIYWRFLDVVWLCMLLLFWLARRSYTG
ncbi:MAG: hypothetical protein R3C12_13340 [Planctomycetaceae bacterium]|nr:hypothetical protein [Planctomycetaceae bacterium]